MSDNIRRKHGKIDINTWNSSESNPIIILIKDINVDIIYLNKMCNKKQLVTL